MSDMIRVLYASHDSSASLCPVTDFGPETAETVRRFHRSFPEYAPTALHQLSSLAEKLGVAEIMIKDESTRFGLNAFKVLGGSYAIGHHIAGMLGIDPALMTRDLLISEDTRKKLGDLTFITATDGNHGRGVAWTAKQLRQHCVVYMPAGTAAERLENIRRLGADASIPGPGYDDCVRLAAKHARENGWVLTQDTSWNGYEEIPLRIMQGYTTMALETAEQLGDTVPTHVFLQAGVGSMAGAVAAFLAARYGQARPKIIVVEPHSADCVYRTAEAADGKPHPVTGPMETIMAGLACGEVCPLAWKILRDHADAFVTIPDSFAMQGMRMLGNPVGTDPVTVSGESGASGFGLALQLLSDPALRETKDALGVNKDSRILCFSTEGATDRENYDRIMKDPIKGGIPAADPGISSLFLHQ